MELYYRITGPQSIERLEPLLSSLSSSIIWKPIDDSDNTISFVWETTCEKNWRERHNSSIILNKLHNTTILESKSNLAFLQLRMSCSSNDNDNYGVLETYVASSGSLVKKWVYDRWSDSFNYNNKNRNDNNNDWWVIKASKGNGGRDIFIINNNNYDSVLILLNDNDEYVIQKYVNNPMLWNGFKKFHFRCYTMFTADFTAFVYQEAFALTASDDFNYDNDDTTRHITNLSVNKKYPNHPGQIPVNVMIEYPTIFNGIKSLWADLVNAAVAFMSHQKSPNFFEFFGLDVIADESCKCWLIEVNRLPGLESSKNNTVQEDDMYNTMMTSLLRIVCHPLINSKNYDELGLWCKVKDASSEAKTTSTEVWRNNFAWKAFTLKNRENVTVKDTVISSKNNDKCAIPSCTVIINLLNCSGCRKVKYCSKSCQQMHWVEHRKQCIKNSNNTNNNSNNNNNINHNSNKADINNNNIPNNEKRSCRCMFCGQLLELDSEEAAIDHMSSCPSLQEQLSDPAQFTIPKEMREV